MSEIGLPISPDPIYIPGPDEVADLELDSPPDFVPEDWPEGPKSSD